MKRVSYSVLGKVGRVWECACARVPARVLSWSAASAPLRKLLPSANCPRRVLQATPPHVMLCPVLQATLRPEIQLLNKLLAADEKEAWQQASLWGLEKQRLDGNLQ